MTRVLEVMGPSEGGIARHVALVTEGLDGRDGLQVDIAGPTDLPVALPKEPKELHIPSGALGGHRRARGRLRALAGGYDVVHAHGLRAGIDAGIACRGLRKKVFLTVHNLVQPEIAGRLRALFHARAEPLAVRLTDHTFAASEQIAAHLRKVASRQAHKIETLHAPVGEPPPVVRSRAEVRAELGLAEDEQLVVTAARLAPQKALHVMLAALARLPQEVRLAVVGSGPLEDELKELSARLGLGARVSWLGFRPDVGDFIAAADVLCLSSVWEAVALAAQEAVLLGTPVVSTDVGGMSELITDGHSGRLVPKGDDVALAEALRDVLASETERKRLADNALDDLERRFSREAMLERLSRAYREATG